LELAIKVNIVYSHSPDCKSHEKLPSARVAAMVGHSVFQIVLRLTFSAPGQNIT
jgi:hypothetical protein